MNILLHLYFIPGIFVALLPDMWWALDESGFFDTCALERRRKILCPLRGGWAPSFASMTRLKLEGGAWP